MWCIIYNLILKLYNRDWISDDTAFIDTMKSIHYQTEPTLTDLWQQLIILLKHKNILFIYSDIILLDFRKKIIDNMFYCHKSWRNILSKVKQYYLFNN